MFAHNHIIANFVIRTLKLPGMEQQKTGAEKIIFFNNKKL